MPQPTYEELKVRIAELESTIQRPAVLSFKVTQKGGVSIYGVGPHPVTLYYDQWGRLLDSGDDLCKFLEVNKSKLKLKGMNPVLKGMNPVRLGIKRPKSSVPKKQSRLPKWRSKPKDGMGQKAAEAPKETQERESPLSYLARFRASVEQAKKVRAHFVQGGRSDSGRQRH
jgi:hypothetical protein